MSDKGRAEREGWRQEAAPGGSGSSRSHVGSPQLRSTPAPSQLRCRFRSISGAPKVPPPDRYLSLNPSLLFLPRPLPPGSAPAVTPGSRTPSPSVTLSGPDGVAPGPCPVASIVPVLCIITSPKKKEKKNTKDFFFFPFCNRKEIVAELLHGRGFHNFQHDLVVLVLF